MGPYDILMLIAIALCVVMSACFSATETAFSTLNRIRIKTMAEDGDKRAKKVLKLIDGYDALISTILVGNNIVNILSASLATVLFVRLCGEATGTVLSTVVLTLVILLFGEVTPKTIAKRFPERFALGVVGFTSGLKILLFPITYLFLLWQKLLSKIFKNDDDKGITEEELISIVEEAEEEGDFSTDESDLIKSAIEFSELEVGDIFTPRIDVTAIEKALPPEEIRTVFTTTGYSRIPVYDGDLDNIVGILYYKDFFNANLFESDIDSLIKPVLYVAKTQKINDLLKELQEKKMHLAIVTDEYGSTAGIVTLEDILEEIVGDIWDEHDEVIEEFRELGENEFIVKGMANVAKIFEEIGIDREPDALTINGWAMAVLGRIPQEGDTFEADCLSAKVLKMNGRRIENLHLLKLPDPEEEENE